MDFRTEFRVKPSNIRLDPENPIVLLGSCFSDNIGGVMRKSLWDARVNDCGVLFNPVSIASVVKTSIIPGLWKSRPVEVGEGYSDLGFSGFFEATPEALERTCLEKLKILSESLRASQALIVTFGTAWIYELIEDGNVVSNCHKQDARLFRRRLCSVAEIVEEWSGVVDEIFKNNPELKIIFTISPVRHLRDGLADNSLSKSVLRVAVGELCKIIGDRADYFPAYEILNDDLRDYRFYAEDMIHPSEQAVDYIWTQFQLTYLSDQSIKLLREGRKLTQRINHRPLHGLTTEYIEFQEKTESMIDTFHKKHPKML